MHRRDFLAGTAPAAAGLAATGASGHRGAAAAAWNAGPVAHLLPAVSHERVLVKLSLREPAAGPLFLHLDNRRVPGRRADTAGEFWGFDAAGLDPARAYTLALADGAGGRSATLGRSRPSPRRGTGRGASACCSSPALAATTCPAATCRCPRAPACSTAP